MASPFKSTSSGSQALASVLVELSDSEEDNNINNIGKGNKGSLKQDKGKKRAFSPGHSSQNQPHTLKRTRPELRKVVDLSISSDEEGQTDKSSQGTQNAHNSYKAVDNELALDSKAGCLRRVQQKRACIDHPFGKATSRATSDGNSRAGVEVLVVSSDCDDDLEPSPDQQRIQEQVDEARWQKMDGFSGDISDSQLARQLAEEEERLALGRLEQTQKDEIYVKAMLQAEERAEKRIQEAANKGKGKQTESSIAFQVTMDAEGNTIEGDEDADNSAHLELVKKDFGGSNNFNNMRIKRVTYFVNFELNRRFEAAKDALAEAGHDNTERTLFHGTPTQNVQPILEDGFKVGGMNLLRGGVDVANGTAFGTGIYLATCPSTSFSYCRGGTKMFACRVLTGNTTSSIMRKPPLPPGLNAFDAYEQSGIVVVRHPDQVLPRYVVEFEYGFQFAGLPVTAPPPVLPLLSPWTFNGNPSLGVPLGTSQIGPFLGRAGPTMPPVPAPKRQRATAKPTCKSAAKPRARQGASAKPRVNPSPSVKISASLQTPAGTSHAPFGTRRTPGQ